jgi:hypothetical protein
VSVRNFVLNRRPIGLIPEAATSDSGSNVSHKVQMTKGQRLW